MCVERVVFRVTCRGEIAPYIRTKRAEIRNGSSNCFLVERHQQIGLDSLGTVAKLGDNNVTFSAMSLVTKRTRMVELCVCVCGGGGPDAPFVPFCVGLAHKI